MRATTHRRYFIMYVVPLAPHIDASFRKRAAYTHSVTLSFSALTTLTFSWETLSTTIFDGKNAENVEHNHDWYLKTATRRDTKVISRIYRKRSIIATNRTHRYSPAIAHRYFRHFRHFCRYDTHLWWIKDAKTRSDVDQYRHDGCSMQKEHGREFDFARRRGMRCEKW